MKCFPYVVLLGTVSSTTPPYDFDIPTPPECRTTQCAVVEGAPQNATAAQINACLESTHSNCVFIAHYSPEHVTELKSCSSQSTWAGGSQIYGYDLSSLAPILPGPLKTISGYVSISLNEMTLAQNCVATYAFTGINTSTSTCTEVATIGGTSLPYREGTYSITIRLTKAIFSAVPLGTNLQIGSATYTDCGGFYASASQSVSYEIEYRGTSHVGGTLGTAALGLLAALYFLM